MPSILWLLHPRDLISVHVVATSDGHIFSDDEALLTEAEADLVVTFPHGIVEIPGAAGLAAQPADTLVPGAEPADTAGLLVSLPFGRVEAAIGGERHEKIIPFLPITGGMALFAGKQQPHMLEFRCDRAG